MRIALRWIVKLWNRWEPQPTWQEVLRLTVIETTLALGLIWLGEAIF